MRRPSKRPASRYSYDRVVANVERMIQTAGTQQKKVAEAIGNSETVFSQKMRGVRSHFTVEEIGGIADFFSTVTGRRLYGFPFLDLELTSILDDKLSTK